MRILLDASVPPFLRAAKGGYDRFPMACRGPALFVILLLAMFALPRVAHADQPGAHTVPVAVLGFDSEDSEEQADAITGAVRSRIRAAQGWALIETTQSLGILTAAMKCPTRPPPECQQKIAEQLKAERYIFGFVTRGPTQGQVTAEIHLYQKGKPDTAIKESYADNLKDANDDTLRKIAAHLVERLGGTAVGIVVVRAASELGNEVVIDGDKHLPLDKGSARLELAAGGHSIEVASPGGPAIKRNVLVTAGRETVVEFTAAPVTELPSDISPAKTRKLIGGVSMGVGAVLAGIAVYELFHYLSIQDEGKDAVSGVPKGSQCQTPRCIDIDARSKTASGLGIGLGAGAAVAIGVGAYLFFTSPPASAVGTDKASATPPKPNTRIAPAVGAGTGGVMVLGTF